MSIGAKWANARKVQQIVFKLDWNKHAKAAPFKRNDATLATLPAGLVVFSGNGITDNLADKARAMRIRLESRDRGMSKNSLESRTRSRLSLQAPRQLSRCR